MRTERRFERRFWFLQPRVACPRIDTIGLLSRGQVKRTTTPVICVCNDRLKDSVKSLADSCLDLKFSPPELPKVVQRLTAIATSEHFVVRALCSLRTPKQAACVCVFPLSLFFSLFYFSF